MIDLLNSMDALKKIASQDLNGGLAYKISKIIKIVSDELILYNQSREKMLQEYCIKNEDGTIKFQNNETVTLLPDKIEVYNKEIRELNNLELELNITQLNEDDLSNIKISPNDIINIEWTIKKEDE